MIETQVTLATRRAYEAAHAERARAIRAALGWLFPSATAR